MQTIPETGQLAIVRKRPFVVTEIIPAAPGLGSDANKPNHLIKLSSVEDDGLGEELQVIWELEPGTSVYEKSTLPSDYSDDYLNDEDYEMKTGEVANSVSQTLAPLTATEQNQLRQLSDYAKSPEIPLSVLANKLAKPTAAHQPEQFKLF